MMQRRADVWSCCVCGILHKLKTGVFISDDEDHTVPAMANPKVSKNGL